MSQKGHTNNPRGRPKGSRNKLTVVMNEWLERSVMDAGSTYKHPMNILLDIANGSIDGKEVSLELRHRAAKDLMPYLANRLPDKIELSGSDGGPIEYSQVRHSVENILAIRSKEDDIADG